jgi:hypothetical protein
MHRDSAGHGSAACADTGVSTVTAIVAAPAAASSRRFID